MRRPARSKQPAYLTEYIQYAVESRFSQWYNELPQFTVTLGFGISILLGIIAMLIKDHGGWDGTPLVQGFCGTFAVYMLGVFGIAQTRKSKEADPQLELRREARQVAQRLEHVIHEKRAHRDVSDEVVFLLEEAARNWHRARTVLQSPYWKRADLPSHYRSVRDQSLLAIDQGMQEMLVLFATSVPKEPGKWSLRELVDEAIGHDFFSTRSRLDHISPYFDEARSVAQKIVDVADHVETISKQIAGQELITGVPKPGTALEATLAELRQIEEAESELRQDLRG